MLLTLLASGYVYSGGVNEDKKRAQEIRLLMWNSGDKDFTETKIPEKWKNKSAVIIAKSKTLAYKKAPIVAKLYYDHYSHYRIMLLNSAALEKYAQFSIPGSISYGSESFESYAGFKVIKPDGREIEISLNDAVKETRKFNTLDFESYKLAIPGLEAGDILDYYLCEENTIGVTSKYYSFDPVILQLHDDYPIMKQKISFDVLRRCYINLNTLNGAGDFQVREDAKEEKSHYYLEDSDRESVDDIPWLYPYRELPTIKFKISYASAGAAAVIPGFIGDPGQIKSGVSKYEVEKMVSYLFGYAQSSYLPLRDYMKKNFKKVKDKNKLAVEAYYALRNISKIKDAEADLLQGEETSSNRGRLQAMSSLSAYYRYKKINHEVIIGVPRNISDLSDLILENELTFMIKVKGDKPFYIGGLDNYSTIGEIDPDLQGATVYVTDGLASPASWILRQTEMPVTPHDANNTSSVMMAKIKDMSDGTLEVDFTRTLTGSSKRPYQYALLDFYHYKDEEKKKFGMKEDFSGYPKSMVNKLVKKREDYMSTREDNLNKRLKEIAENDFDFTIEEASDLNIINTGRYDTKPEFNYGGKLVVKDALKKVGPNYLLDIGKFIEGQIHITNEQKERKYNIYMPFARSFNYHIEFQIPEGYTVQGLEKLNSDLQNSTGGFTSHAKLEDKKLIIDTYKYYKSNFEKKEDWPLMVDFLNAAYDFTQKQVLLKKE